MPETEKAVAAPPTADEMLDWCGEWLQSVETLDAPKGKVGVAINYSRKENDDRDEPETVKRTAATMTAAFRECVAFAMEHHK